MSDSTTTATPPPSAGLEQGNQLKDGDGPPARRGDELLTAAAAGGDVTQREAQDLVGYFLTNDGLPGDDEPIPVKWTVGTGSKERSNTWMVKPISWEEWQDGVDRATDGDTGVMDTYVAASWHVARALVEPALGPKVKQAQAASPGAPQDAAELVRRMFKKQAGVLLELSAAVLKISKLQRDNGSVRTLDLEVQAGKD